MELFGKSADELAGIIDDGGAALRALGQEAENLGVIIPEEELEKASEINDSIGKLKAQGSATLMEVGGQIAEMILPYLPQIQEFIQNILAKIREMDPETLKIIGTIAGVMAVLSPVLSTLSSISGIISGIAKVAPGVASSVAGALSSVGTFLTTDINTLLQSGGATAGLTYATALVGSAVAFLAGAEVGKQIGAYLFPSDAELYEHYSGIEGTFEMIKDLGIALKDFFVMAWEDNWKTAEKSWQMVKDAFNTAINFIKTTWDNSWGMMKNTFNSIWAAIKQTFTDSINRFIAGLNKVSRGVSGITGGAINFGQIEYMADGGVLTSGTAIVGEAGPEFVQISNGQAMVQPLTGQSDIAGLLETYLPYLAAGTQLVMDSGALVGSIAPEMNTALGTISIRGGRR
jgi:phage-related protein